jgi:hypothetical protein
MGQKGWTNIAFDKIDEKNSTYRPVNSKNMESRPIAAISVVRASIV